MSQMDLTYSHVIKNPAQLSNGVAPIGLIVLGELSASLDAQASYDDNAKAALVAVLEKAHQANPKKPLRVMLNDQCAATEALQPNPAMGLRGLSRFVSEVGKLGFVFECEVLKQAINEKQLPVEIVVPFVRTSSEAATMIDILAEQGLCRGADGLKVLLAVQLPANAVLAESLLAYFDGMVVDADNLAAFTLGVDFECEALPYEFTKFNEAVKQLISDTFRAAKQAEKPVQLLVNQDDTVLVDLAVSEQVEVIFQ